MIGTIMMIIIYMNNPVKSNAIIFQANQPRMLIPEDTEIRGDSENEYFIQQSANRAEEKELFMTKDKAKHLEKIRVFSSEVSGYQTIGSALISVGNMLFTQYLAVATSQEIIFTTTPIMLSEQRETLSYTVRLSSIDKTCQPFLGFQCEISSIINTFQRNSVLFVYSKRTGKSISDAKETLNFVVHLTIDCISEGNSHLKHSAQFFKLMPLFAKKSPKDLQVVCGNSVIESIKNFDDTMLLRSQFIHFCPFNSISDPQNWGSEINLYSYNIVPGGSAQTKFLFTRSLKRLLGPGQLLRPITQAKIFNVWVYIDFQGIFIQNSDVLDGKEREMFKAKSINIKNAICSEIETNEYSCVLLVHKSNHTELSLSILEISKVGLVVNPFYTRIYDTTDRIDISGCINTWSYIFIIVTYEFESKPSKFLTISRNNKKVEYTNIIEFTYPILSQIRIGGSDKNKIEGLIAITELNSGSSIFYIRITYYSINFPFYVIRMIVDLEESQCYDYLQDCMESEIETYRNLDSPVLQSKTIAYVVGTEFKGVLKRKKSNYIHPIFDEDKLIIIIDDYLIGAVINPSLHLPENLFLNQNSYLDSINCTRAELISEQLSTFSYNYSQYKTLEFEEYDLDYRSFFFEESQGGTFKFNFAVTKGNRLSIISNLYSNHLSVEDQNMVNSLQVFDFLVDASILKIQTIPLEGTGISMKLEMGLNNGFSENFQLSAFQVNSNVIVHHTKQPATFSCRERVLHGTSGFDKSGYFFIVVCSREILFFGLYMSVLNYQYEVQLINRIDQTLIFPELSKIEYGAIIDAKFWVENYVLIHLITASGQVEKVVVLNCDDKYYSCQKVGVIQFKKIEGKSLIIISKERYWFAVIQESNVISICNSRH